MIHLAVMNQQLPVLLQLHLINDGLDGGRIGCCAIIDVGTPSVLQNLKIFELVCPQA